MKWEKKISKGGKVDCGICGNQILPNNNFGLGPLSMDHIVPKSFGGMNKRYNLRPTHRYCNAYRSNRMLYIITVKYQKKIDTYKIEYQRTQKLQKALL